MKKFLVIMALLFCQERAVAEETSWKTTRIGDWELQTTSAGRWKECGSIKEEGEYAFFAEEMTTDGTYSIAALIAFDGYPHELLFFSTMEGELTRARAEAFLGNCPFQEMPRTKEAAFKPEYIPPLAATEADRFKKQIERNVK